MTIDPRSSEPKGGGDLGRLTAVMGAIRPTFERRQRLRQCLIKAGAENLPDYELLQVMLFTSNPHAEVESLVQELLDRFGSLAEVMSADTEVLVAAGLSLPAIAGVKFVREVALRFLRAHLHERPVVGSWDKLIDYCNAQIAYSKVEEFHILFLDGKNALIKDELQQRGTIDHTPVYPREVIKRALDLGASALILVHNHPSGDPTPSHSDIAVTKNIIKVAAPLGITVYDHLIIGRGRHTSLRDLGLIPSRAVSIKADRSEPVSPRQSGLQEKKTLQIESGARRCRRVLSGFCCRITDRVEYAVTSVRLAILDRVCGPEPLTPADRQRETDHDRLQRAFPAIDIDRKGPKR